MVVVSVHVKNVGAAEVRHVYRRYPLAEAAVGEDELVLGVLVGGLPAGARLAVVALKPECVPLQPLQAMTLAS